MCFIMGFRLKQIQNVEMVLERGEKLELLVDRSLELQSQVRYISDC